MPLRTTKALFSIIVEEKKIANEKCVKGFGQKNKREWEVGIDLVGWAGTQPELCLGGVWFLLILSLEVLERSAIAIKKHIKRLNLCLPLTKHYIWRPDSTWSTIHTGKHLSVMSKTLPGVDLVFCTVVHQEMLYISCVNLRHWILGLWICMQSCCHLAGLLVA